MPPLGGPNNTRREKTINWSRRSVADIIAAPSDTPLHLWLVEPREDIDLSGYIADFADLTQQVQITLNASGQGAFPKECCEFSVYTQLQDPLGQRRSQSPDPPVNQSSDAAAHSWLLAQVSYAALLRGLPSKSIPFSGARR